jgi:rubrerythrin
MTGPGGALAVVETAIRQALEYEARVRGVYAKALAQAADPVGRRVFETLAGEEQGHIDYLQSKLETLLVTGTLAPGDLATAIPSRETIEANVARLERALSPSAGVAEADLLRQALEVELETSAFYKRMVEELPKEGRDFFAPFLRIEEGHVAIVQAELDAVQRLGFWFDYREFDLEVG